MINIVFFGTPAIALKSLEYLYNSDKINVLAVVAQEGCISFPEAYTDVKRYANVMVKALDRHGRPFVMEAKDGCLLARAIQHENDHLDGVLFIDHCVNRFETDNILAKHNLPPVDADKLISEPEIDKELENKKND